MNAQATGNVCAKPAVEARRGGFRPREIVYCGPRAAPSPGKLPAARARKRFAFTLIELPVVRKCKAAGFTLIELLVVIAIISLLVSIMMPSLSHARELARRARCAMNLHSIGLGLAQYAQSYGSHPYVPLNGAGWGVAVGTGRDVNPYAGAAEGRNPTSNLYLLVRSSMCEAGMFLCPSTDDRADNGDPEGHWDFSAGTNVSYALANPYGTGPYYDDARGRIALMADGSPYFDPATGLRNAVAPVDLGGSPDEAMVRKGNSPNHRHDGQNVMRFGGSVQFETRADCGYARDNIYTRAVADDGTDPGGDIPAPGADGSASDQGPAGPKDSYLIP